MLHPVVETGITVTTVTLTPMVLSSYSVLVTFTRFSTPFKNWNFNSFTLILFMIGPDISWMNAFRCNADRSTFISRCYSVQSNRYDNAEMLSVWSTEGLWFWKKINGIFCALPALLIYLVQINAIYINIWTIFTPEHRESPALVWAYAIRFLYLEKMNTESGCVVCVNLMRKHL